MNKTVFLVLLVLGGFSYAPLTRAQAIEDVVSYETSVNESDFEFEISPKNPGPFQNVTIRVTSNLVDSNRYPITWTVNEQVVERGIGKRSITVKTGAYGQTVSVRMSIQLVDSIVNKEVILAPQDSTLLWEAVDSYVPPFYRGKKLPARESIVRITSIPNFLSDKTSAGTRNAVYNWKRDGKVVADGSGYGKDSLLIQHNRVRPTETIEVTSSSVNGSAQAVSRINLSFFDPKVLFYAHDPASGLTSPFARALLSLNTPSLTIEAVPYFFSVVNGNPNSIDLMWRMNDRDITTTNPSAKNLLTLRKPAESGTAKLTLNAKNTSKLFQTATANLSVVFTQQ